MSRRGEGRSWVGGKERKSKNTIRLLRQILEDSLGLWKDPSHHGSDKSLMKPFQTTVWSDFGAATLTVRTIQWMRYRSKLPFSPLDFCQGYLLRISDFNL